MVPPRAGLPVADALGVWGGKRTHYHPPFAPVSRRLPRVGGRPRQECGGTPSGGPMVRPVTLLARLWPPLPTHVFARLSAAGRTASPTQPTSSPSPLLSSVPRPTEERRGKGGEGCRERPAARQPPTTAAAVAVARPPPGCRGLLVTTTGRGHCAPPPPRGWRPGEGGPEPSRYVPMPAPS